MLNCGMVPQYASTRKPASYKPCTSSHTRVHKNYFERDVSIQHHLLQTDYTDIDVTMEYIDEPGKVMIASEAATRRARVAD